MLYDACPVLAFVTVTVFGEYLQGIESTAAATFSTSERDGLRGRLPANSTLM